MRYLIVRDWRDHQHYKKRNPPWIKLHRAITENYDFSALKDGTKAHIMLIWILAAGKEGRIPDDPKFIAKRINATDTVNLEELVAAGFLIREDGADEKTEVAEEKKQPFSPPDWIVRDKWDAWVKIRPAKARTPDALRAAVEKLEAFRAAGHDANAIIANSLANGWQGLFASDGKRGAQPTLAERNRAAAAEFAARGIEKIINDK